MEEIIALWGHMGPGGTELYSGGVKDTVEREIFGSTGYQRPQARAPPGPSRAEVLLLLDQTVHAKRSEAGWNPSATSQLGVLTQIGQLINTTNVSPQELGQIMQQLRDMSSASQTPLQPPPPPPLAQSTMLPPRPVYPPPAETYRSYQAPMPTNSNPYPTMAQNSQYDNYRSTPPPRISTPTYPTPPMAHTTLAPVASYPPAPTSALPANIADILRNLGASGLVSARGTPDPVHVEKPRTALDDYEDMILNLDLKLTMHDINKWVTPPVYLTDFRPNSLPLAHLPERCKQCGVRFAEGAEKMQAHMDWHFRRNRKERESEGRGAHRRWLPRAEVGRLFLSADETRSSSSMVSLCAGSGCD